MFFSGKKLSGIVIVNAGVENDVLYSFSKEKVIHGLLTTLISYFVDQLKFESGINSTTLLVVHLHFHKIFGVISIGHGSSSFKSNVLKDTIGKLKNTEIFDERFIRFFSGKTFKTEAQGEDLTI
jgi:hypothetical protein